MLALGTECVVSHSRLGSTTVSMTSSKPSLAGLGTGLGCAQVLHASLGEQRGSSCFCQDKAPP